MLTTSTRSNPSTPPVAANASPTGGTGLRDFLEKRAAKITHTPKG